MPLITRAEYARRRGVTKGAITQVVQKGRIKVTPEGLIDSEAADAMLSPPRAKPPGRQPANGGNGTRLPSMSTGSYELYMQARARREVIEAARAQLKLDAEKEGLVEKAKVQHTAFMGARIARDRILAFADRLAPELAAESDERRVYDKLFHECRMLCDKLAEGLGAAGGNR
jgi:hypothetical protein